MVLLGPKEVVSSSNVLLVDFQICPHSKVKHIHMCTHTRAHMHTRSQVPGQALQCPAKIYTSSTPTLTPLSAPSSAQSSNHHSSDHHCP